MAADDPIAAIPVSLIEGNKPAADGRLKCLLNSLNLTIS
jgi:hypothetical protein